MLQSRQIKTELDSLEITTTITTNEKKHVVVQIIIPNSIRFLLLLTFDIPSILCYIFVIIYILTRKNLRSALNNYVMLIILFISFLIVTLDIPWEIHRYRQNKTYFVPLAICRFAWFIDLFAFYTCQMLVAWASFERHILVFHCYLLNQRWRRICFHYIPPLIIICYMMIFYLYVVYGIPCESSVVFGYDTCHTPCYLADPFLGLYESIFHNLLPTICILIFSYTLLFRVLRSKTHLQRSVNWRKYRKMIFQLFSITTLYLSTSIPYVIIYIVSMVTFFDWTLTALECLAFFGYFIPLFLPFICLTSLPNLRRKIKRTICRRINRQI